jgi:hypothetical protein
VLALTSQTSGPETCHILTQLWGGGDDAQHEYKRSTHSCSPRISCPGTRTSTCSHDCRRRLNDTLTHDVMGIVMSSSHHAQQTQHVKKLIIGIIVNAVAIRFGGKSTCTQAPWKQRYLTILMTRSVAPTTFYPFCWPSTKSSAASV